MLKWNPLGRRAGMCDRCRIIINFRVVVSGSVPVTARGPSSQEDRLSWGGQYLLFAIRLVNDDELSAPG